MGTEHVTAPHRPTNPPPLPTTLYARVLKRVLDLLASSLLLVLLVPVMALVALAVLLFLGPPVLYHDERAGRDGRPIRLAKFRSMSQAADSAGVLLPDAERLGLFGRMLRRTSLDELPQLFSVVTGDMSLVGPRPLPMRYVPRYNARQATRLLVRPGITGLAQVRGRNSLSWPDRLEYDIRYVERLARPGAWLTDLWIVAATAFQIVVQVFTGRGIAAPGMATMEEFRP